MGRRSRVRRWWMLTWLVGVFTGLPAAAIAVGISYGVYRLRPGAGSPLSDWTIYACSVGLAGAMVILWAIVLAGAAVESVHRRQAQGYRDRRARLVVAALIGDRSPPSYSLWLRPEHVPWRVPVATRTRMVTIGPEDAPREVRRVDYADVESILERAGRRSSPLIALGAVPATVTSRGGQPADPDRGWSSLFELLAPSASTIFLAPAPSNLAQLEWLRQRPDLLARCVLVVAPSVPLSEDRDRDSDGITMADARTDALRALAGVMAPADREGVIDAPAGMLLTLRPADGGWLSPAWRWPFEPGPADDEMVDVRRLIAALNSRLAAREISTGSDDR